MRIYEFHLHFFAPKPLLALVLALCMSSRGRTYAKREFCFSCVAPALVLMPGFACPQLLPLCFRLFSLVMTRLNKCLIIGEQVMKDFKSYHSNTTTCEGQP